MINVHVKARSPVVRAGLEALLRGSGRMTVTTSAEADVLIADGDAPREDGLPAVILTDEPGNHVRTGARGVLPRSATEVEIAAAVDAVAAGLVAVHPDFLDSLNALTRSQTVALDEPLTPRETEVLRLLVEGVGNKEIAYRLGISEHTVKFHVASLLDKLDAESRTEAVANGVRAGLVTL